MTIKWTLKNFKISDLKDYYKNPRTLTDQQYAHLKVSLDKFGLIDKPIVTQAGLIIGGHQRKRVLEKEGINEVECYVPDRNLTEKEIEELNLRLNQNGGSFDFEVLANQWEVQELLEWGFSEEELSIKQIMEPDLGEDAQTALEASKAPKSCPNCGHKL